MCSTVASNKEEVALVQGTYVDVLKAKHRELEEALEDRVGEAQVAGADLPQRGHAGAGRGDDGVRLVLSVDVEEPPGQAIRVLEAPAVQGGLAAAGLVLGVADLVPQAGEEPRRGHRHLGAQ